MIGQTYIRYGDLQVFNCQTRDFQQRAVFDPSGTDLLYFEFTVRVVGFLHDRSAITSLGMTPATFSGNPANNHKATRYIVEPRKSFEMRVGTDDGGTGGTVLLEADPAPNSNDTSLSGIDVNNGPKCTVYALTQLTANNLFRAELEFVVCKVECDSQGNAGNNRTGVLNNRWSVTDDIGENRTTVRTWQGRLRVASSRFNPMSFRQFVLPVLLPGFKRESMHFRATEDGLNLEYQIVDRESFYAAPFPATSWDYQHTATTGDALQTFEEITVRMSADRGTDKRNLTRLCAAFIESRIVRSQNINRDPILEHVSFTDIGGDYDNTIVAKAVTRQVDKSDDLVGTLVSFKNVGKPVSANDFASVMTNYHRDHSRDVLSRTPIVSGPIGFMAALSAHLQSPCDSDHSMTQGIRATNTPPGSGPVFSGSIVEKLPTLSAGELPEGSSQYLNSDHHQAMYTYSQVQSSYDEKQLLVQMPIARSSSGSSSDEDTSAFVSIGPSQLKRVVRVRCERFGAYPKLQRPVTRYTDRSGAVVRLLRKNVVPQNPVRMADGTQLFVIDAEYIYGLSKPIPDDMPLLVGLNPWETDGIHYTDYSTLQGRQA